MTTIDDIVRGKRAKHIKPSEDQLRSLPHGVAFILGRLSSPAQVKDSRESMREIANLVVLAIKDGYHTTIAPDDITRWMIDIQEGKAAAGVWEEGQIIVDVRDLGISGRLSSNDRPGLAHLQQSITDGNTGTAYVTEISRFSRDTERITPYQLLKLLKDHDCRVRTPDGIWSPRIQRDWDYLKDEFEAGIDELGLMAKRLNRKRKNKAARGEYVGELILPGFIVPIVETEPSGRQRYGKYQRYAPHAEVCERVLREFIRQNGSPRKTHHALGKDLAYPLFPPELRYMERLTSLRKSTRTNQGYRISPAMIRGLATNPKLIGAWNWGDTEPRLDNHEAAVPTGLFMEAYALAAQSRKPRGKGITHEPLEYTNLLWCYQHDEPRLISGHPAKGAYRCQSDYVQGRGPSCFAIASHYLATPLTKAILRQLDFAPLAEEVLMELELDQNRAGVEMETHVREIAALERKLKNFKSYLGCDDPAKEDTYWQLIREAERALGEKRIHSPCQRIIPDTDYQLVRTFLTGLRDNWDTYSRSLRNRLLKLIIERVEIRHERENVEATIRWKTGQTQVLNIRRARAKRNLESRWTKEEINLLKMLWPASSQEVIGTALPGRSWRAIAHQATQKGFKRTACQSRGSPRRRWGLDDEQEAKQLYESGALILDMSNQLGRTQSAILQRAREKGWQRPQKERGIATTDCLSTNQNPEVTNRISSGLR